MNGVLTLALYREGGGGVAGAISGLQGEGEPSNCKREDPEPVGIKSLCLPIRLLIFQILGPFL